MPKFQKGISGNYKGRPRGVSDKRNNLRKLLEPFGDALVQKAVEMALLGEPQALRLCIERLIPRAKDEAININIPENLDTTEAVVEIGNEILRLIERQEITPDQAKSIMEVLKVHHQNILDLDFDRRLTQLERGSK